MKFSALSVAATALLGLSKLELASSALEEGSLDRAIECNKKFGPLIFVLLEDEAVNAAIEDDIRRDLDQLGFEVEKRALSKADINTARQSGNFHFSITETWGTPYDPHSYASGWIDGNGGEGVFPAMVNFDPPSSRSELLDMVEDVLQQENPAVLKTKWEAIHKYYHEQAMMLPLYGKRIPTLLNRRLEGYSAGSQQFDYPVHKLRVASGSTTATIAPGARTGLFNTVGTMNAHVYGPNEFFSNNWVYEGLVSYGEGGSINPSLATSWVVAENDIGGDDYTFTLRPNVKFHDDADWNCDVAKLNFDHVLAPALSSGKHGWFGVGSFTDSWYCNGDMEFVVRTNKKHGPYLQELTLIRPIRFMSPNAFPGNGADPNAANSCHLDWGTVDGTEFTEAVNCAGIESIAGTGPWKYVDKDEADGATTRVIFDANEGYWAGAPDIKRLEIVRYATATEVKEALESGQLDIVWGSGVLSDSDIVEIRDDPVLSEKISVHHSGDLQNVILLLNTGNPPFDDINVRKSVIHAINKNFIVQNELKGLQQVVQNIFPLEAPYCDVELFPRWDYDFEKAVLLSCDGTAGSKPIVQTAPPSVTPGTPAPVAPEINTETVIKTETETDDDLVIGLGVGLGSLAVIAGIIALVTCTQNNKLAQELEVKKGGEVA